jgi:hypothetical protein
MIRFTLATARSALAFPDDDDGQRLDVIEAAFNHATGFRREKLWSTPLEELRLLAGPAGAVLLRWDGYFTEIVPAKSSPVALPDLALALDRSDAFTRA